MQVFCSPCVKALDVLHHFWNNGLRVKYQLSCLSSRNKTEVFQDINKYFVVIEDKTDYSKHKISQKLFTIVGCFLTALLIESTYHEIHLFKVYISLIFNIDSCNQHYQFWNICITPERNLIPFINFPSFVLNLYRFAYSVHFI